MPKFIINTIVVLSNFFILGLGYLLKGYYLWAFGAFFFPIFFDLAILQPFNLYEKNYIFPIIYISSLIFFIGIIIHSGLIKEKKMIKWQFFTSLICLVILFNAHDALLDNDMPPYKYHIMDSDQEHILNELNIEHNNEIFLFKTEENVTDDAYRWLFMDKDGAYHVAPPQKLGTSEWTPVGRPLYILFSHDLNRIGTRLDTPPNDTTELDY